MDKTNWKEKAGGVVHKTRAQVSRLVQMCKENKKTIVIVAVFLAFMVGVFLLINVSEKKEEAVAVAEMEQAKEEGLVVPEEALEKDAYPEVVNLVKQYYQAMVEGDMDTIKSIKNYLDDEEELKIIKKSEFIEAYPMITVHTKKGPQEGSYVAYVQYEVKFVGHDTTAPGLNTLYICTGEDGKLYINANELEESVVEYLKTISVQNDVVDLFNTVQVAYNDVKTQDEDLSAFLDKLPNLLAEAVSEAIEEQEAVKAASEPENAEEEPVVQIIVKTVKTKDVVNVRSSDSLEADKVGKTTKGQILELLEERVNGWSKVNFEGKEGFIKTEFLEPEDTETIVNESSDAEVETSEEGSKETAEKKDNSEEQFDTPKKAKIANSVRVREKGNMEAKVIGALYQGEDISVLGRTNDGWLKVEYQGKTAYVSAEYVELKE